MKIVDAGNGVPDGLVFAMPLNLGWHFFFTEIGITALFINQQPVIN